MTDELVNCIEAEDSDIVGCNITSSGERFLVIQKDVLSPSVVKQSK
jgi:hypothetical protein